ncbi:hypothetical protein KVT40_009003 [Elsinoe batatas]|uniref:Uncharacterized protein n=1 Tax=Elsinoe batatas TaxID=2601811 RepID=A0A8K0KV05_9PEZI|nr:hypothetical protein KVT40_009003 [Elsinoe batatas]
MARIPNPPPKDDSNPRVKEENWNPRANFIKFRKFVEAALVLKEPVIHQVFLQGKHQNGIVNRSNGISHSAKKRVKQSLHSISYGEAMVAALAARLPAAYGLGPNTTLKDIADALGHADPFSGTAFAIDSPWMMELLDWQYEAYSRDESLVERYVEPTKDDAGEEPEAQTSGGGEQDGALTGPGDDGTQRSDVGGHINRRSPRSHNRGVERVNEAGAEKAGEDDSVGPGEDNTPGHTGYNTDAAGQEDKDDVDMSVAVANQMEMTPIEQTKKPKVILKFK